MSGDGLDLNAIARRWIDGSTVRSDNTDVPALLDEVARLRALLAPLLADPYRLADPVVCCFCAARVGVRHRADCPVRDRAALLGEER